jgi:hypothetical protein
MGQTGRKHKKTTLIWDKSIKIRDKNKSIPMLLEMLNRDY